jgi:hypothetical protein
MWRPRTAAVELGFVVSCEELRRLPSFGFSRAAVDNLIFRNSGCECLHNPADLRNLTVGAGEIFEIAFRQFWFGIAEMNANEELRPLVRPARTKVGTLCVLRMLSRHAKTEDRRISSRDRI